MNSQTSSVKSTPEFGRTFSLLFLVIHQIPTIWQPRVEALQAIAVAALGEAAPRLARRCLAREDAALALLRGVYADETGDMSGLFISGDFEVLPWVDGALYLGRDTDAPSLLLPTTLRPDVPLAWFQSALLRQMTQFGSAPAPPLAVCPAQGVVISLAEARPIDRTRLELWLSCADQLPAEVIA